MKKKILFVITKSNWGGAQRYVYDLAVSLSPFYECTVALGGSGLLRTRLETAGVTVIAIPSLERDISIQKELVAFFFLVKFLRKESYDIVHLNSSKAGGLGALAARFAKIPRVIFTAHGWPFNEPRGLLSRGAIYIASSITALLSDAIITISHKDYAQGIQMPGMKRKIFYIPLGIDTPLTAYQSKEGARKFLLQTPAFAQFHNGQEKRLTMLGAHRIIGTVGELTKNKGIEYGIRAIALLNKKTQQKNHFYVLIGDGEEKGALESLAKSLNVTDQIFFIGFIPDAWKYLNALDCFLLPSLKEGLPYVILEATRVACPIVATSVGGIPDVLHTYPNGKLIPTKNPEEIARAILALNTIRNTDEILSEKNTLATMLTETKKVYEPIPTTS
ncbi:glycosyltransferase family 1 protein [Patescibacteria group bacterium]|nr:MAG: glycosyltransferase family 1 protein [Patescibacteria group bacterium]